MQKDIKDSLLIKNSSVFFNLYFLYSIKPYYIEIVNQSIEFSVKEKVLGYS